MLPTETEAAVAGGSGDSTQQALARYRKMQAFAQQLGVAASQIKADLFAIESSTKTVPDDFAGALEFFDAQADYTRLNCESNSCQGIHATMDQSLRGAASGLSLAMSNSAIVLRVARGDLADLQNLVKDAAARNPDESLGSDAFASAVASANANLPNVRAFEAIVNARLNNLRTELEKVKSQQADVDHAIAVARARTSAVSWSGTRLMKVLGTSIFVALIMI